MNSPLPLSQQGYNDWRLLPTTKLLFDHMENYITMVEKTMISDGVIFNPNSSVELARLAGIREGIKYLLNLEYSDFKTEEEE